MNNMFQCAHTRFYAVKPSRGFLLVSGMALLALFALTSPSTGQEFRTLNFDDVVITPPPPGQPPVFPQFNSYSQNGVNIHGENGALFTVLPAIGSPGNVASFSDPHSVFTYSLVDGVSFDLVSLDVNLFNTSVTFMSSSGATLFDLVDQGTLRFGQGFSNITWFQQDKSGGAASSLTIDNVVVRVVPEPGGVALFASLGSTGVALLLCCRKRRR